MKNIITIDLNTLDKEKPVGLIISEKGELALEAENELKKILETRDLLDKIIDYVKERLGEEMDKKRLIKVKGDSLTITKRSFGTRYSLGLNPREDFVSVVSYQKVNPEAIDNFVAENGSLPEGIIMKEREEKVSIIRRDEDL